MKKSFFVVNYLLNARKFKQAAIIVNQLILFVLLFQLHIFKPIKPIIWKKEFFQYAKWCVEIKNDLSQ